MLITTLLLGALNGISHFFGLLVTLSTFGWGCTLMTSPTELGQEVECLQYTRKGVKDE